MNETKQSLSLYQVIKDKINEVRGDKKLAILWVCFFIFSMGILSMRLTLRQDSAELSTAKPKSMDEYIPDGLTLLPIALENGEAVQEIISSAGGLVDLYTSATTTGRSMRIAKKVKIVRTGIENQFAVLIPTEEGHLLLNHRGPFVASVLNVHGRTEGLQSLKQGATHSSPEIIYGNSK